MTVNDSVLFLRPDGGDDWWDALDSSGTSPHTQLHSRVSTALGNDTFSFGLNAILSWSSLAQGRYAVTVAAGSGDRSREQTNKQYANHTEHNAPRLPRTR